MEQAGLENSAPAEQQVLRMSEGEVWSWWDTLGALSKGNMGKAEVGADYLTSVDQEIPDKLA